LIYRIEDIEKEKGQTHRSAPTENTINVGVTLCGHPNNDNSNNDNSNNDNPKIIILDLQSRF